MEHIEKSQITPGCNLHSVAATDKTPGRHYSQVLRLIRQFNTALIRHWPVWVSSLFYLVLTIILTWPLILESSQTLFGVGDVYHDLWTLWHAREALLGRDGWFTTSYLYYPQGISLWVHALGPLLGVISFPLWSIGPVFAYNVILFFGVWMTGIAMYVLARELRFSFLVALFAGTLYVVTPIHLLALHGHLSKIFLGLLPLSLWAYYRALAPYHGARWTIIAGLLLLAALLHSTEQFIFAGMAFAVYGIIRLGLAVRSDRVFLLRRIMMTAGAALLLCIYPLVEIWRASHYFDINVATNAQSLLHHPDLLQIFLPIGLGRLFYGWLVDKITFEIMAPVATNLFLTWTAILLIAVAIGRRIKPAREWMLFTFVFLVLSLGPYLRVGGDTSFTDYQIPIVLPYAFLNSLPGLEHMRTPGRFMLVGNIGVAIVASYGLSWLSTRLSADLNNRFVSTLCIGLCIVLLVLETWTNSMHRSSLPAVSDFYEQIADDSEMYGIFDLPIKPDSIHAYPQWHIYQSSMYQMLQMSHRKGIASGYVSRYYAVHPLFAQIIGENYLSRLPDQADVYVNGEQANRYENLMYELYSNNYRYVVVHNFGLDGLPIPEWGRAASQTFIDEVFVDQEPVYQDHLLTVYEVMPVKDKGELSYGIAMLEPTDVQQHWDQFHRLLLSPAQFVIYSPETRLAELELEVESLYNSELEKDYDSAIVYVYTDNALVSSIPISPEEEVRIPIPLSAWTQRLNIVFLEEEQTPTQLSDLKTMDLIDAKLDRLNLNLSTMRDSYPVSEEGHFATLKQSKNPSEPSLVLWDGWYESDTDEENTITWHWASSPASVAVYSDDTTQMKLTAHVVALHDPTSADGKGMTGVLKFWDESGLLADKTIQVGEPFMLDFTATEGWNMISMALDSGNYQPVDYIPTSGDTRSISFALADIEIKDGGEITDE